jgi:hypothetical protein
VFTGEAYDGFLLDDHICGLCVKIFWEHLRSPVEVFLSFLGVAVCFSRRIISVLCFVDFDGTILLSCKYFAIGAL